MNMWKYLEVEEKNFIFNMKTEDDSLTLTISDMKYIWREKITSTDILYRFKEMNPSFESNEHIKDSIVEIMNEIDKATEIKTYSKDDILELLIKTKLEDKYFVSFKFILNKLVEEDFFSKITSPMIQTILFLEQSQNDLSNLLKRKDRELQEYKLEKGEISREDLKTEPYNFNIKINKREELMLNLFQMSIWQPTSCTNCPSELDSNSCVADYSKETKSLKRKVYSANNSNKKPML